PWEKDEQTRPLACGGRRGRRARARGPGQQQNEAGRAKGAADGKRAGDLYGERGGERAWLCPLESRLSQAPGVGAFCGEQRRSLQCRMQMTTRPERQVSSPQV